MGAHHSTTGNLDEQALTHRCLNAMFLTSILSETSQKASNCHEDSDSSATGMVQIGLREVEILIEAVKKVIFKSTN